MFWSTILSLFAKFRIIDNETLCKTLFDEYVLHLQQKAKEKERKREEEKVYSINQSLRCILWLKTRSIS
jgi:hypothetical protein